MKRWISALLCTLMLAGTMPDAQASAYNTYTLSKGVLGTLGSSGASYEAKLTVPGYIGQLEDTLIIDDEEKEVSISVVHITGKEHATIGIDLSRFDGCIYKADLYPTQYNYVPETGFESKEIRSLDGQSTQTGGSLDFGTKGGFFSGRIYFYYSLEDLNYRNIDVIPNEKWTELFWFNLGVDYVLVLTDADIETFLESGELDGYTWPGLRRLLNGEGDMLQYTEGSFEHFDTVNPYQIGVFSDISTQWYAPYAARAYEVNLIKGNADGTFYAEGRMTVAEAITIAARLHNIYYGHSGQFEQGSPWHQVYVDYAVECGMIENDTFEDYERPVTRKEMAALFSKAVELTDLERINEEVTIPDVEKSDEDYAAIQALYESGVLTGSKADGSFLPDDEIIRAEVATMIARLVTAELRVKAE